MTAPFAKGRWGLFSRLYRERSERDIKLKYCTCRNRERHRETEIQRERET
jgi:hypothetical protein